MSHRKFLENSRGYGFDTHHKEDGWLFVDLELTQSGARHEYTVDELKELVTFGRAKENDFVLAERVGDRKVAGIYRTKLELETREEIKERRVKVPERLRPMMMVIDGGETAFFRHTTYINDARCRLELDRNGGDDCEIIDNEFHFIFGPQFEPWSCYDWMNGIVNPVVERFGAEIDIGDAENYHTVAMPGMTAQKADEIFDALRRALMDATPSDVVFEDTSLIHNYHMEDA
jgi:hypothetical protein